MNYFEWKSKMVNNYQITYHNKLKQFGITSLVGTNDFVKDLILNNIIGATKLELLESSYETDETLNIIVGFGGNGKIHLGHLSIINEILFYLRKNIKIKIFFVNFDIGYKNIFINNMIYFLKNNYSRLIDYEIIDNNSIDILKLKKVIAQNISINEINRIMGWTNRNYYDYEKVLNMLTTYFINNLWKENTIVLSDINQLTFYGLAKNLEKKLKMVLPIFTYHTLMTSLKSPSERMSIKKEKSTIFFDEDKNIISKKLYSAYTGNNNKIETCSYLKILDLFYQREYIEDKINNYCLCNKKCDNCKKCSNEDLTNKIIKKKLR